MKRKWKNLNKSETMLFLILILFIVLTIGITVFLTQIYTSNQLAKEKYKEYNKHFVMIGKNPSDPFWLSIYETAKERGEELGAYVENYGEHLSRDYTVEERLEMIVAAGTDRTIDKIHGIIVEADTDPRTKELIDQACDQNMPVVTILTDSGDDTKRKSFIGIDHRELGKSYGEYIQEIIAGAAGDMQVKVLLDYGSKEGYQDITFYGINDSLKQDRVNIEFTRIDKEAMFSAEETIRDLVLDPDGRPDILVCLSEEDTIAAQQVVIDLNMVGAVRILGYYGSEEILNGINKGIIEATAVIDTDELGTGSIEALDEYVSNTYVTEWQLTGNEVYFITSENVEEYLEGVR